MTGTKETKKIGSESERNGDGMESSDSKILKTKT